jgi:DNA polymerase-3 subunit epsilon
MNFVAIDFETANYNRQSVCSVGLAIVENFKIVGTVNKLIKPTPNYYEHINVSIHGIRPEMTEKEKNFSELWPELRPYLEHHHVVAHNASFDFSALRNTLDTYGIEYPELNYYCSMLISKKLYSGLYNYQLPTVCNYLDIDLLNHHDAVFDAVACAKIMIKVCKDLDLEKFSDIEEKLSITPGKFLPDGYKPFSCNAKKKRM